MIDTKQERLQSRLVPEIQAFRDQCKTLQLATLNDGIPHVSYSPFAYTAEGYFILVSDLAQHGQNLKSSRSVSIMMIEDESQAKSVYARRRLGFDTVAQQVNKDSVGGQDALHALRQRFGDIIDNLSQLGDFHLYRLTPEKGRYVKGFGQAFDVSGDEMVEIVHLTEGHLAKQKQPLT
ncbi:heme utilization protein HutZ [Vibrio sp. 10N.286.49.B3]|uniref:heme utilization protein HutZ n=1 Tax=Vibrio sp. 10N.286.49.B3 TaxID=1880855 RepID=UPI000C851E27|nr:heme utilization protein HutZ [Vibrio sp. 10N.286.49.B3]PMH37106.1 heme utilization protein HutZ [Vibrio sp. 10N.286.49.B3]